MFSLILNLLLIPTLVQAFSSVGGNAIIPRSDRSFYSAFNLKTTFALKSSFFDPPDPSEFPNDGKSANSEADEIEFESDIDWDAEWKKVTSGEQSNINRPSGRAKTDIELAAIRAKRSAETKLYEAQGEARKIKYKMNWNSLKGDWKFWVGVLALISVATSLLAAQGQSSSANYDSFYI